MVKIWVKKLLDGTKTWADVPASRVDGCVELLQEIAADDTDPRKDRAQELLDEIINAQTEG